MIKFGALFKLFLRHQSSTGRAALIAGFCFILLASSLVVNRANVGQERLESSVELMANMGLMLAVPIVALVLASATLGDLVEDETLVYLWHRPTPRWMIAVSAWASAVVASIPTIAIPIALGALLASGGSFRIAGAALLSSIVAVIGYCALFTFAGVIVKKSLVWGLLYIFIWESLLSSLFISLGHLSIRAYAMDLMERLSDVTDTGGLHSVPTSIIAPLVGAGLFVALTGWRLDRMDVA